MALTNQMSKASYIRGNKVTIVKNPENCGSKKFKFGVDSEADRWSWPKVGGKGKIAKRLGGGWYLVRMDTGHLVKMRPAAFRASDKVTKVMDEWNEVSDHPPPSLDLLIRTAETEQLRTTVEVLENKVQALETELLQTKSDQQLRDARFDEMTVRLAASESEGTELRENCQELATQLEHAKNSLERAVQAANAAGDRSFELEHENQQIKAKNTEIEEALYRHARARIQLLEQVQQLKAKIHCQGEAVDFEGSSSCDCIEEEQHEDCLGCDSGVDCAQAHTCSD